MGALSLRSFKWRWAVTARWRHLRGLSGEFAAVEQSPRSSELSQRWERAWPGAEPSRFSLRAGNERWVRFHSLPDGKRYADNADEAREMLRRHHEVLEALSGGAPPEQLLVLAPDHGRHDLGSGWSKAYLPDPWPWRTFIDDSSESRVFCWAASGLTQRQLDALLTACAEDQAFPLILDQSMCWIYCPYDGGADVVLATEAERLWLEERHSDWLPD